MRQANSKRKRCKTRKPFESSTDGSNEVKNKRSLKAIRRDKNATRRRKENGI